MMRYEEFISIIKIYFSTQNTEASLNNFFLLIQFDYFFQQQAFYYVSLEKTNNLAQVK